MKFIKINNKLFCLKNIKSCLFVPGNQEKMLKKSYNLNSDIIVPDLEDSVPLSQKNKACETIIKHLPYMKGKIFPRVNSLSSGLFDNDIKNLINKQTIDLIQGLVIPKISTVKEFSDVHNKIIECEKIYSKVNKLKMIIWIESPQGIINIKEILEFNIDVKRLIGVAIGAEDFCNEFRISKSKDLEIMKFAKCLLALNVYSYGLIPFDTPCVDFKNNDILIKEIEDAKSYGFKGKFAIHPNQIDTINNCFLPTEHEILHAQKVVQAFDKALSDGKASIDLDGKMVDYPVYKNALNILDLIKK